MSDSSDAENDAIEKAFRSIKNVQDVIDFTETHLLGLRTECAPNAEVTQNEIRTQETKLIKLFSKQLVEKERVSNEDINDRLGEYPKTDQWLRVVGLNDEVIKGILLDDINMSSLLKMSGEDVRSVFLSFNTEESDIIKLVIALRNLKLWTERQLHRNNNMNDSDLELHWTQSFNQSGSVSSGNSPKNPPTGRSSTSSLPETTQPLPVPNAPKSNPSSPTPVHAEGKYRHTPPPTPIVQNRGGASSRTPPANRFRRPPANISLFPEYPSSNMIRSHSTEINLPIKVTNVDGIQKLKGKSNMEMRLANDISHVIRRPSNDDNIGHTSPVLSSPSFNNGDSNLVVPKSPKPTHKLSNTFKITTCNVCHKQMIFGMKCKVCKFKRGYIMNVVCDVCHKHIYLMGKICKLCKFKCHRECASKASQTCQPDRDSSPSPVPMDRNGSFLKPNPNSVPDFRNDSGSNPSSCNSSTPSSPIVTHYSVPSPGTAETFVYPEVNLSDADGDVFIAKEVLSSKDDRDFVSTNTSDDSNKTLVDSTASEKTLEREDSVDSQDGLGHRWDRGQSLSITLREWDIPFEQLKIEDHIGTGRFGTVYKGTWHGQVAIKMLHMDSDTDNQAQIAAFKLEVAMLKNTRHENLLLFMGACMKPPKLAIVTSYCSGQTLYAYVRTSREKFQMHKTILIAQQIAQGMGYLHAKGIVHKDLKTKNIFLENGKIVITDFGLFNVTKLCHGNRKGDWLHISPGWLCYLSPEVIRCLSAGRSKQDLPFSEKSDIYAFGTIWYELLVGDWPFRNQPTECIIWQVGRGMKQSLGSVTAPREVKDILMRCWSYTCDDRPQFKQLLKAMDKLPKKRLVRSPSHPVQMSRSMDSVFTA